jgi:hypothetical protein
MQTKTSPADGSVVATLIDGVGTLLCGSECNTMECIEALSYVLGDAMAQTTDRKHHPAVLAAVTLFLTEAYALGCAPLDSITTTQ